MNINLGLEWFIKKRGKDFSQSNWLCDELFHALRHFSGRLHWRYGVFTDSSESNKAYVRSLVLIDSHDWTLHFYLRSPDRAVILHSYITTVVFKLHCTDTLFHNLLMPHSTFSTLFVLTSPDPPLSLNNLPSLSMAPLDFAVPLPGWPQSIYSL